VRYVVFFAVLMSSAALAHGPEQWIADKRLSDPVTHQFCCGPDDCSVLDSKNVAEVSGGYNVKVAGTNFTEEGFVPNEHTEFVPYSQALPFSPDGHYHLCVRYDDSLATIRCFIVPPGAV
jgi:hypothetical protein